MKILMREFKKNSEAIGLKAYLDKCKVYFDGVQETDKQAITAELVSHKVSCLSNI